MHLVFYKTNDVFVAEELLISNNIEVEIVPTPVQDKAYCGVCVRVDALTEQITTILSDLEYETVKWGVCIGLRISWNIAKL